MTNSWAIYLRHEEVDFTEFVASFSDGRDAAKAREKLEAEIWENSDEEDDLPVVILVEE